MPWVAINCPQCSAPLPRVALWRAVKCPSCGALITKTESVVSRADFRQAFQRAREASARTGRTVQCGGQVYELTDFLGTGVISEVHRARRQGTHSLLATVKLSSNSDATEHFGREVAALADLRASAGDGEAGYVRQRFPEVIAHGAVEGDAGQRALILHHPTGYWGSLADLNARFPQGLDPRHAVWVWRRLLDALQYLHSRDWIHGDIRPEHALVHPADHGVRLIGWASARRDSDADARAADLLRCARVVLVLLCGADASAKVTGGVPPGLAALLHRACEDEGFCRTHGAGGLDSLLRTEAGNAFGPPVFVPLVV